MKIRLIKNKSIFLSWLVSYFLLLLMPLLVSMVVYLQAYRIVETEISHVNSEEIKQVRMALDNGLQSIEKFSTYVAFDQNLNLLMKEVTRENLLNRYYLVYHSINDLKSYNITNEYVNDYYIYLKNLDCVLTKYGLEPSDGFFNMNRTSDLFKGFTSFSQWLEFLGKEYPGEYLPLNMTVPGSSSSVKPVIYAKSLPIFGLGQPCATLIITLNNQRFYDTIRSISSTNNALGVILDSRDNILFSSKPIDGSLPARYADMPGTSGFLYGKLNNVDVTVTYTTSGIHSWKYISVLPISIFEEKVVYIKRLIILSVTISIILGGIISYFFSRRNYGPIGQLVKALGSKVGLPFDKRFNEYRYIQDVVSNTFNENEKMIERLDRQSSALRANFLMRLLKGKLEDTILIQNTMESYDLNFDSEYFSVLLLSIETDFQPVQPIITNLVEVLTSKNNRVYVTEVDGMLACIINIKFSSMEDYKRQMLAAATEAAASIRENFKTDPLISASGIHKTVFGLSEAYQESLSAMEYKKAMGIENIVCFDDIRTSKSSYHYPMDTERQLINCIKSGDFQMACSILDEVFENNFTPAAMSNVMAKCLVFDLASTMLKTIPEADVLNDNTFLNELDIFERLLSCKMIKDMKLQIVDIMKEICLYIQQNRKGRKETLVENVIEYIQDNYSDANLSVSAIAGRFQLTPTYLTKLFKEQTGEGLLDYLIKIRIQKAKQLMKNNDVSIKDLAEKVGYFSSAAFIRAFKKCEGVTPGLYKEIG